VTPWGETTSVGGQKEQSALLNLTCDRAAADQIDWSNVDEEGLKTLCTYEPLVDFE
jgi:hypothetical protein